MPQVGELVPRLEACRATAEAARPVVPPEFCCPISYDLMREPVVAADGITYEKERIERWLADHDTSPGSGAKLPHKFLTPNLMALELCKRALAY